MNFKNLPKKLLQALINKELHLQLLKNIARKMKQEIILIKIYLDIKKINACNLFIKSKLLLTIVN